MRISFNANKITGPYGGVNQFCLALEKYLLEKNHYVTRRLETNLDIILLVSSKTDPTTTSYTAQDIVQYKQTNRGTRVIQRLNSRNGQRAGFVDIDSHMIEANRSADATVFVSQFLKDYYADKVTDKPMFLIRNGVDTSVFNPIGGAIWDGQALLSLVTHHNSTNLFKGFEFYQKLDSLSGRDFSFTCIGNIPYGMNFSHHVSALSGQDLAFELKKHHVYITASKMESGPNHPIEAANCGLPVLYIDSGSLREYCQGYGVCFSEDNVLEKTEEIKVDYLNKRKAALKNEFTYDRMGQEYEKMFLALKTQS